MKKVIFAVINDLIYDQRMQRICTSLATAGYDVTLIGRRLHADQDAGRLPYRTIRFRCLVNKGKIFYIEYNIRLFFLLLFRKFDMACAIDLDTLLPVVMNCRIRKKKCIYDAHEYFTEVPELENRNITKKIWELTAAAGIPHTHLCYTVSGSLTQILSEKYHKPFQLIRNVPLLKDIMHPLKPVPRQIIYQGAVNRGRGLKELLMATEDLDVSVLLVGDGDITVEIRELAGRPGLSSKVKMTGAVRPSDIPALTASSWLGYNMLDPVSLSYYYSLSNKFFDYIHAGIPVLTNNFPEYRKINEIFEVSVLSDFQTENIRKCILFLLENEDYYSLLKENCQKAREKFNWQQEEKLLLKLYGEL